MYYVVQVQTGKEDKTIDAIYRQLGDKEGFDVFSPYRIKVEKTKGVEHQNKERCFPGYIFVETDEPYELFKNLYFTPEFTKMLGRFGLTNDFIPLNKDESRMIDILYSKNSNRVTSTSDITITPGENIRVLDGPLYGVLANVKSVNLHKRLVVVTFPLCGREVEAKLAINIVTNVINK